MYITCSDSISRQSCRILHDAQALGIRTNLEAIQTVLLFFDNPQNKIKTVHVAGTNGKGSVCAMIESMLRFSGYKTGLYTSPHLVRVEERIKYNGAHISGGDLDDLLKDIHRACIKKKITLTYFEILTCAAFLYFYQKNVDCACIETGMGGRWDATNTIEKPLATVITSLAVEHEQYLGSSLHAIAHEKAAIIKKKVPVFCAPYANGDVKKVIEGACRTKKSSLYVCGKDFFVHLRHYRNMTQRILCTDTSGKSNAYSVKLVGTHQHINAGVARAVVGALHKDNGFNLKESGIARGLREVYWPARCEYVVWRQGRRRIKLLLDSAHNPAAIEALVESLRMMRALPVVLLLGVLKDKDYASMARAVIPYVHTIMTLPIHHKRALSPEVLADAIKKQGLKEVKTVLTWRKLFNELDAIKKCTFVMAGSMYLIGEFLKENNAYLTK